MKPFVISVVYFVISVVISVVISGFLCTEGATWLYVCYLPGTFFYKVASKGKGG